MRVQPEQTKKRLIQERYWEKEEQFRGQPNSENVWQERTERLVDFANRDPDKDGVFDGLWARSPPEQDDKS